MRDTGQTRGTPEGAWRRGSGALPRKTSRVSLSSSTRNATIRCRRLCLVYGGLIALYACGSALDVISTRLALAAGVGEFNPLIASLLRTPGGWQMLVLAKALDLLVTLGLVWLTPRLVGQKISAWALVPLLALMDLGLAAAVAHNWLLAIALGRPA